jgi:hypothetical protein
MIVVKLKKRQHAYVFKQTWINTCASGKSGSFFSLLIDLFLTEASNYLCVDLVLPRLISRGIREIGNESLNVMYNLRMAREGISELSFVA